MKLLPGLLVLSALAASAHAEISPKVVKAETKAFVRADKDDDEKLDYEEFKLLFKPLTVALKKFPATGRGDNPWALLEFSGALFSWFDSNDDLRIDLNEWLEGRYPADLDGISVPIYREFLSLDRNQDGRVPLKEFLPLVKCFIPAPLAKKIYLQIVAAEAQSSDIGSGATTGISQAWSNTDPAGAAEWVSGVSANEGASGTVRPVDAVPVESPSQAFGNTAPETEGRPPR